MLVLSRRTQESLIVGDNIVITILGIKKNSVRVGIEAPPEVSVNRAEVQQRIELELARPNQEKAAPLVCV